MANRATYEVWGGPLAGLAGVVLGAVLVGVALLGESSSFLAFTLAMFVYSLWWGLVAFAYKAVLTVDGELWFKSVLRERRCTVEDVRKISVLYGENTRSFKIRTAVGSVRISHPRGDEIVDAIRSANPGVRFKDWKFGFGDDTDV